MDTIYVISGCMRSFTSMMMQCMEAGGMACVYADKTEEMPDACGLHEMSVQQRRDLFRDPQVFSGKCIKMLCSYGWIPLPKWEGRYKVILMVRDPLEIAESYRKMFDKPLVYEGDTEILPFTPELYGEILKATVADAGARGDMDLLVLSGSAIIAEPLKRFETIAEYWPVNAEKAAAIVEPEKYRTRLEEQVT